MDLSERPSDASRRHPWEVSRARFFRRVLVESGRAGAQRVLDAGAGDAFVSREMLATLAPDARVTCWDSNYTPELLAEFARESDPRLQLVRERPTARFDLMLLLDLLEHVEDDRGFLSSLVRDNLEPGGAVLVSVPAYQGLFTTHDTRLRHYRRYSPDAGAALVESAGLTILRRGGLFHSLLVPRALGKLAETLRPPTSTGTPPSLAWRGGTLLTRAIDWALAADNELSWRASESETHVPGLSWWALCEKR